MNLGRLKDTDAKYVPREPRHVVEAADERPGKVITDAGCVTQENELLAREFLAEPRAKFVAMSTGFSLAGATVEDIRVLREGLFGSKFGVMASGRIEMPEPRWQ